MLTRLNSILQTQVDGKEREVEDSKDKKMRREGYGLPALMLRMLRLG
jgi:hypothetical protein